MGVFNLLKRFFNIEGDAEHNNKAEQYRQEEQDAYIGSIRAYWDYMEKRLGNIEIDETDGVPYRGTIPESYTKVTEILNVDPSKYGSKSILSHGVSSDFGIMRTIFGVTSLHEGTDFYYKEGDPVYAPLGGIVAYVGYDSINGNHIKLSHSNGYSSFYCHFSKISVTANQKVVTNDMLGLAGTTGRSTGPHLHLALKNSQGKFIDPLPWLQNLEKVQATQAAQVQKDSIIYTSSGRGKVKILNYRDRDAALNMFLKVQAQNKFADYVKLSTDKFEFVGHRGEIWNNFHPVLVDALNSFIKQGDIKSLFNVTLNHKKIKITNGFKVADFGRPKENLVHRCGLAVDIVIPDAYNEDFLGNDIYVNQVTFQSNTRDYGYIAGKADLLRVYFADMANAWGFGGITVADTYVHIDCGPKTTWDTAGSQTKYTIMRNR